MARNCTLCGENLYTLFYRLQQTFYRWKSKFGDMEISEAKRLKQLEDENRRLKQIVADLTLDNQALKWVVQKNELSLPAKKR